MFKWLWNKYLWAEAKAIDQSPGFIKDFASNHKGWFRLVIFILFLVPMGLTAYGVFAFAWRVFAWITTALAWMLTIK